MKNTGKTIKKLELVKTAISKFQQQFILGKGDTTKGDDTLCLSGNATSCKANIKTGPTATG
jgi:hypothetical protein